MAERSKALVLGTSLFGGVGSNPTAAINFFSSDLLPAKNKGMVISFGFSFECLTEILFGNRAI